MGYLKIFVAVITISLIQDLTSANKLWELHSKLAALKVSESTLEKADKFTSLQSRDVSDCINDINDLLTQMKSLLSTFPQASSFVAQLEAQLAQCSQGAGTAASTCITDIFSEIVEDLQTISTEIITAIAAIAADIPKLIACASTSSPSTVSS